MSVMKFKLPIGSDRVLILSFFFKKSIKLIFKKRENSFTLSVI